MRHPDGSGSAPTPPHAGPRACLVPGCTCLARRRPRHGTPLEERACLDPAGLVQLCCAHHAMRDRLELFVSAGVRGYLFWDASGARIAARPVPSAARPALEAHAGRGDADRPRRRERG